MSSPCLVWLFGAPFPKTSCETCRCTVCAKPSALAEPCLPSPAGTACRAVPNRSFRAWAVRAGGAPRHGGGRGSGLPGDPGRTPARPRRGPPGRAERLLPLLPPALLPCAQRRCARSEVKTFGGERCFRPKARRGTARSAGASFPIDWGGLGKSCPRCGLAERRGRSKDGARGGTGHLRPRARARRGPHALNLPQPPSGKRALRLKQRASRASPAPAALKSIFSHSFPSPLRV